MDRNHVPRNLSAKGCFLQFSLFVPLVILPSISLAVDCSNPPSGFGGSWARAYKNWCESCGGTYSSSGPSCIPGPDWGGTPSYQQPQYDYEAERQRQEEEHQRQLEAERQRQREIEEQRKKEEEEAKRRQEEFERNKQEALKSMKGITEGELGLKGSDADGLGLKDIGDTGTSGLGLKDVQTPASKTQSRKTECEWGNMDSSVVDLRCLGLDPNKPIAVDPWVVKGKERVFPAQIDPKTFENVNYNKGFEALMRFDAASAAAAVKYFKEAQKERPNDPMVRNGLLLAQDILKARQKKEKDNQAKAAYFILQSYASLMTGDIINARHYIAQARQFDPANDNAKFVESLSTVDLGHAGTSPARKEAYQLVASSLVSIYKQHYPVAIDLLDAAKRLQPEDKFIGMFLRELHKYEAGSASVSTDETKK